MPQTPTEKCTTRIDLRGSQQAFIAAPEKALLDLIHLQPGGDAAEYLPELRLQKLDVLDPEKLQHLAERASSPRLKRATANVTELAKAERAYQTL